MTNNDNKQLFLPKPLYRHIGIITLISASCATMQVNAETTNRRAIEEIVVTAQKKQESLQDIPIAVSAISGEAIQDSHILDLQGLRGSVPNVQINNFSNTPNSAVFTIRGIGVVEPDPYAGNTVGVVVDGVPQYFNMVSLLDLFDIERIEILRGPQGTLFGANTTGGVVNVITAPPTGEYGGKASFTLGNYNRFDANVAVDFPIIDNELAGKVTLMSHGRDGWVTNAVNGEDMGSRDVKAFRGYLDWTPGDDFEALLITEYVRARNGAPIVVSGAVPGEALYVVPGTDNMYQQPCTTQTNSCSAPGKYYSANSSVPDISNQDTFGMTLNLSWSNTPIGDVVSITGYKEYDQLEYTDQDGTTQFLDDTRRTAEGWQLSQELRTTLAPTDRMEVMAGTFLMKTHYELIQDFRIPFAVAGLRQENKQDQDNWSASLFTQMYYDLSEQLKLQAGLRYTVEETEMAAGTYNFLDSSGFVEFGGGSNIGGFDDKKTERWENLGGKIGLDYQLNADLLLYGYFAHGFKSGGFVGRVGTPLDIGPYDPEKVDTFEIGLKGDFFDGLMRSNLAVFTTEYDDMQLAQIYFARDNQGNVVQGNSILNAATSSIEGAELELTFLPADGLTISSSLAYLKAEYDEFDAYDPVSNGTRDLSGLTLQNSPEFSANISASYEFSLGAGYSKIKIEYQYSDEKYLTSIDNAPRTLIDSTEIINLNFDWTPQHDQWSIGVWARNLTDERYIASTFDAAGTLALVNYAAPRELGISMKFNW